MTITARAREVLTQTDTVVQQTVRFFNNGVPFKDAPMSYPPGVDQATAQANLTAVVKAAIAARASDGSTVACAVGTLIDLTDPAPAPPTQAQLAQAAYFDARRKVGTLLELQRLGRAEITQQMVDDARTAWNALPYLSSYEGLS